MAALVEALDTPKQYGENGNVEHGWSSNAEEQLLQWSFQCTRMDESTIRNLSKQLETILEKIIHQHKIKQLTFGEYQELMITAYKMIGHTRDIIDGKGEYTLSYMQILVWYKFFPDLAKFALRCFVHLDNDLHPYGSWKDIKYFCNYCLQNGVTSTHPLVQYALELITNEMKKNETSQTLIAKWIPREKSKKFGWIFNELAQLHFCHYLESAKDTDKKNRAILKAKTDYRKLIARANIDLDTVQIKQCDKRWAQIDHTKTTSVTLAKQKKAFLNLTKNGEQRTMDEDRIQCAKHFTEMIEEATNKDSTKNIKGKRVGLNYFTKEAMQLLNPESKSQVEIDLLNSQWRDNALQTQTLGPMIAMVDTSGSMMCNDESQPFYAAVALGCRIAEKSVLGRRVLTFTEEPTWHNLDMCYTFTSMVESIQTADAGYSTNFYKALKLVLDAIVEKKMTSEEVSGITLVILSDMQINEADDEYDSTMYKNIEKMYAEAGEKICGAPYKPPHILLWNLRSTSGFPCLSNQKNASMMSGFSPALLNNFCESGLEGLQNTTPWISLRESMNQPRYQFLEDKIKESLMFS
uniref:DUF7788 domain-containing protein n=1 Tax=viral metagenome TaxID=1070528 RepID=A0A6C0LDN1_9ZZZZ